MTLTFLTLDKNDVVEHYKTNAHSFQNPVGCYQLCSETYFNDVVNLNTSGRANGLRL